MSEEVIADFQIEPFHNRQSAISNFKSTMAWAFPMSKIIYIGETISVSVENRLQWLNSLPLKVAVQELMKCCGSRRWAEAVAGKRPFHSIEELNELADTVWWSLDENDWLEAFRSHPRIGEKTAATTESVQAQQWSGQEQAGVRDAAADTVASLAQLNQEYDAKFGHIFIVCATGKSSNEMLDILRQRLTNDPAEELRIAAAEQAKITTIRIGRLLA